jgi:hypothetical protein
MQGFKLGPTDLPPKVKMWYAVNVADERAIRTVTIQGTDTDGVHRLVECTVDCRITTCGVVAAFALGALDVSGDTASLQDDGGWVYTPDQRLIDIAPDDAVGIAFTLKVSPNVVVRISARHHMSHCSITHSLLLPRDAHPVS